MQLYFLYHLELKLIQFQNALVFLISVILTHLRQNREGVLWIQAQEVK